eukprot:CAMPEP_0118688056 /NCGR_PEP_ID=MMETSP0800-20121206/8716_1 /TAXON_ID=210618 ORGANISM="Striatella unipunctata, Strain CCMP2910" /NCGR_SAMPLE_ID=MMETSP0800 /ASSEMBLY_ACC=CAM_ASM_000638 /LENGTH=46 /DNA_ID= /DNA_START= /DNA_END= /DNA_ORIENTATION=
MTRPPFPSPLGIHWDVSNRSCCARVEGLMADLIGLVAADESDDEEE